MLAFSKMCLYISVYGFYLLKGYYQLVYGSCSSRFFRLFYCIWKQGNAIKQQYYLPLPHFFCWLQQYGGMDAPGNLMMGLAAVAWLCGGLSGKKGETIQNSTEGALVLKAALRSVFTAGVLDTPLEHEIRLSYVNGVSAGTMAGMNYISGQKGRMLRINKEYLHDRRYGTEEPGEKRLIFTFDFCIRRI